MSDSLRNVLLIAHAFPPSLAPGAARVKRFYKFLPEFGYRPHVITATPAANAAALPDVLRVPEPPRDALLGFSERVVRKVLSAPDEGLTWTFPATAAGRRLLSSEPFAAILSTIPPVPDHWIGARLSREFQVPWIADFRDPLVGSPFRKETGVLGWMDRVTEQRVFDQATLLVTITDRIAREWKDRQPQYADKIRVLWNGYDPDEALSAKPIPPRPYKILSHVGSLYGGRSPSVPLRSLQRMIDRGILNPAELRIRLIGDLDEEVLHQCHSIFDKLIAAGILEYVTAHVPRAEALAIMSESDYLLLADNNSRDIGQTVPAKLFEYIRIGRPILALTARQSPAQEILSRSGMPHIAIHPGDAEDQIDQKMATLLRMPSGPSQPSEWFQNEFDGRRQTQTLAGMLDACGPPA